MAQKELMLSDLFKQFIKESYSGKRLKKDGKKIRPQTVDNYKAVQFLLTEFENHTGTPIRIKLITGNNKKELLAERRYWNKFYLNFTTFLYKQKGCYDNYVGTVIKIIRIFFNYLKQQKLLAVGDFYKQFYICREEVPVITLLPEQLQFLITDTTFETSLSPALQQSKDIFVLGCTVALRFSDLFEIRFSDVEKVGNAWYLGVVSIKTETPTRIKLPAYAIAILEKFRQTAGKRKTILPVISKNQFNKNVRLIAEKAGWTQAIGKTRTKRGQVLPLINPNTKESYRFCDLLSSHTMRRTAVTTLLMLGMPEHIVKKISGHTADSKAFYRYVNLVQSYLDTQVDKVFDQLGMSITNSAS